MNYPVAGTALGADGASEFERFGSGHVKTEFWINRLNHSLYFMPQIVFRRMHAKCNALAQTSFEGTRKHTKFMKKLVFPLGRHQSGCRRTF